MNHHPTPYRPINVHLRIAAAVAAATVATSILSAVLLCFQTASPEQWLAPTPELLALVANCDRRPARDARDHCKQQIVAARVARDKQSVQLAQH